MIKWYNDEEVGIHFSSTPSVVMRVILPSMGKWQKEQISKYPFLNKTNLEIVLFDYSKNKRYPIYIPKNYTWDGATIPRMLWRLIGPKTSPEFLIPSMIHDKLCERHNLIDNDRQFSSKVFKALLLGAGVGKVKAQTMYLAVDNFQKLFGKWGQV
jgi:hypothetical protein